jgi:hypothetical protein
MTEMERNYSWFTAQNVAEEMSLRDWLQRCEHEESTETIGLQKYLRGEQRKE